MTLSDARHFLGGLGRFILSVGLLFGCTAMMVWPIWTLATKHSSAYTTLIGACGLGLAVLMAIRRALRRRKSRKIGRP
jgi:hypothetical protein